VGGASASLPPSAARLSSPAHLSALRGELVRDLQALELSLIDKRGPAGAQEAYARGREITLGVVRRWRRRLGDLGA
jgi:hypothetical protein